MEIKTTREVCYNMAELDYIAPESQLSFEQKEEIDYYSQKEWVSVESMLSEIKIIKKLVKKYRLEHAGLGLLEARLNGMIIDLEKEE